MAIRVSIDDVVAADLATNLRLPQLPPADTTRPDKAAVEYSQHRTKLSTHRTALSENRTEMSGRRTGMSFQRTRMSADRTLMSVIRTALSLISFGFTIYQFFEHLVEKNMLNGQTNAARNFGATLIYLGVAMVAVGIVYHLQFMSGLRRERIEMTEHGLIHAQSRFPASFTLLVAILVLALGIAAIASLTFQIGPFG
jgi:uncharacterized membrane protein YidH (DUF202 family)